MRSKWVRTIGYNRLAVARSWFLIALTNRPVARTSSTDSFKAYARYVVTACAGGVSGSVVVVVAVPVTTMSPTADEPVPPGHAVR